MRLALLTLLAAASTYASVHLPQKTFSGVCPAVAFSHEWKEQKGGQYVISFTPDNPSLPFKWIDVHVAMETVDGQLLGVVRNYKMRASPGRGVWSASLQDPQHLARLRQGANDVMFKYSFTYCVGVNGSPVDCDTEAFPFERFEWRAKAFPACPTDCGLTNPKVERGVDCIEVGSGRSVPGMRCLKHLKPLQIKECPSTEPCVTFTLREALKECPQECGLMESYLPVETTCMGSDGMEYPLEYCKDLAQPEPIYCPATPACVTYSWKAIAVKCPTQCGMEATEVLPEVICIGSDGDTYSGEYCANQPRPAARYCPATDPCVTFFWKPLTVKCPTECGLDATEILPDALCMGSDGQMHAGHHCANLPRPNAITCPKTAPCVTFEWEAMAVQCPSECGQDASEILPDALCMGSDGQMHNAQMCANIPRPPSVKCPATEACVTFTWRGGLYECPSDCGMEASVQYVPVSCVGTDGQLYPNSMCTGQPKPTVKCPATGPCVTYSWRAGMVGECPVQCGQPASIIPTPATCMGSDGSIARNSLCDPALKPGVIQCPAPPPCPLNPQCHPIQFEQSVRKQGAAAQLVFSPLGKTIHRRNFEFVDAHYWVEDLAGNKIVEQENQRVAHPSSGHAFDFIHAVTRSKIYQALKNPNNRLAYFFTYCVDKIDCDTDVSFWTPPRY